MLCLSLPRFCHQRMMKPSAVNASSKAMASAGILARYDFDGRGGCWIGSGKGRGNEFTAVTIAKVPKNRRLSISPLASSALVETRNSPRANFYQEVLEAARDKFTLDISFQSKDKDISLAKALFYVAAEDEAFMAFNREIDLQSLHKERREASLTSDVQEWESLETMPLGGKNINQWLAELDAIAREVEAELVPREIGCHLAEVLEAVNTVLFESRGFKRSPVLVDSKCAYLHSVLSSGCCSAILLSVIYIEVCRRLNLTIVGSRVGEDFLIWPPTGNPEELFKVTSGHSLFGVVNGKCVNDPRSKASDINSNSLLGLEIATNRDIIGIALANLIRLYWKRASRTNHGLMLTSPLSKILLSKYGRYFNVNPKGWRLFADLLENAAYGMEILTPAFPHLFVPIGAAAGAGRSAAALIQAATRSCFYVGFAAQRNFAEVIAKGEAQGMVSKSIGILLGIALANCVQSSTPLALASFAVITWIHMYCNLKSYQSIQLRTLNPYRAGLVYSEYLLSGLVPSVKEVNDEEPLFPAVPFLNIKPTCKELAEVLSEDAKDAAANIEHRLELGSKLSDVVKYREDALALFDLFQDEGYILTEHKGRFCVALKESSSPQDMLKSLFQVSYLYWLEKNAGIKSSSTSDDCRPGGRLKMSLEYVQREFNHVKSDSEAAGWVTDGLIARPLPNRICPGYATASLASEG